MLLLWISFSVLSGIACLSLYNFFTVKRLVPATPKHTPFVSILIPARNEEKNIQHCIENVLKQDYPHYEVLVMDDNSEDTTWNILHKYKDTKLHIFKGKALPKGWTGKNWACQQLQEKAKGNIFLFIDADVLLAPQALSSAIALYEKENVQMLSCFPQQKLQSMGEWLIIPLIDFFTLSLIPFDQVRKTKTPNISLAIGQFILIDKKAYQKIGTHASVAEMNTEDVEIARNMKAAGCSISVVRSLGLVKCRMYQDLGTSIQGLSRSFYRGAHMHPLIYMLALIAYVTFFILPLLLALSHTIYLIVILPLLIMRITTSLLAKQNLFLGLILFPLHLCVTVLIALNSLYMTLTHQLIWKGRVLK